jgi:hypothetical protein
MGNSPNTFTQVARVYLRRKDCVLALAVLVVWLFLFAMGTLINSEPYRQTIVGWRGSPLSWAFVSALIMTLLTWTPVNVALLAGGSGLLGTLGRYAGLEEGDGEAPDVSNPYFSALIRSFFIYLLFVSGLMMIVETPITQPTQQQYLRLAALVSLICFLVSYSQRAFGKILRSAADRMERRSTKASG